VVCAGLEHKSGNISEMHKQRKSYYGGSIGTHQRSFEWYHHDPLRPPLPQDCGFTTPTQNSNRYYLKRTGQKYRKAV